MFVGLGLSWDFSSASVLSLFMCDCMNLAVFSFWAWGELPVLMMLLISSLVRPMLSHSSVIVGCPGVVSHPFPLDLSLLCCSLLQAVGMGLSPMQIHLVL